MHPEDKKVWLNHLDQKIEQQKKRVQESEHARNSADGKMQSRYDTQKENYALEVSIGLSTLETLQKACTEIDESPLRFKAEPGADIGAVLNGEPQRFLVLKTRVELPGITVISPDSPIGKAISDKIAGDRVAYEIGSKRFSVEILSVL